jgi:hypothetical protein
MVIICHWHCHLSQYKNELSGETREQTEGTTQRTEATTHNTIKQLQLTSFPPIPRCMSETLHRGLCGNDVGCNRLIVFCVFSCGCLFCGFARKPLLYPKRWQHWWQMLAWPAELTTSVQLPWAPFQLGWPHRSSAQLSSVQDPFLSDTPPQS